MLARNASPHVGPRVEPSRDTSTSSLLQVFLHDRLDFLLDVRKRLVGDIRNLVVYAVFLQLETFAGKEDICFPGSCEIRHTIADEDDKRNLAIHTCVCGFSPTFVDREGFVVA